MKQVLCYFKREKVLSISLILAVVSAFFVHPDSRYIDYVDVRTLAILFGLMIVVKGFQDVGLLDWLNQKLFGNMKNSRRLALVLILLCYFTSMVMTNDVALITFVPFAILTLHACDLQKLVIPVVVLQTIAANLGSMMMPIGNPQNIYLFSTYEMNGLDFFRTVLPVSVIAFLLIIVTTFVMIQNEQISFHMEAETTLGKKDSLTLLLYFVLFVLNLLVVFRALTWPPVIIITIALLLLARKFHLFPQVDYALLVTFVGFFVFVGNMGRIPAIRDGISTLMEGREVFISALFSQFLSNVPAAILLSEFTDKGSLLVVGTNVGGLGTLIASMASLISYKAYAVSKGARRGKYFKAFTLYNLALFVVLLLFSVLYYQ